jgi:hypothetical protein
MPGLKSVIVSLPGVGPEHELIGATTAGQRVGMAGREDHVVAGGPLQRDVRGEVVRLKIRLSVSLAPWPSVTVSAT